MNTKLIIKNFTFKNIFNLSKPILFLGFILYCAITIGLAEGVLRNLLIFLYTIGSISAIIIINYFSEVVTIDKGGIKKDSLLFSQFIEWRNIKSVDVQLTTVNKLTKTLEKGEYFENFYVGKKEILVSDLENQLQQSLLKKWKKTIRLPFNEDTVEILRSNNLMV